MITTTRSSRSAWMVSLLLLAACGPSGVESGTNADAAATPDAAAATAGDTVQVSGTGVHYMSTAVQHAREERPDGETLRSSDIIRLEGDLNGYVLYHPVTEIDYASATLVNTGTQYFSGTVLGSDPLLLEDDTFRFEVDLNSGATTGQVHLYRRSDRESGYDCDLDVVGTGQTDAGDTTVEYTGSCVAYDGA